MQQSPSGEHEKHSNSKQLLQLRTPKYWAAFTGNSYERLLSRCQQARAPSFDRGIQLRSARAWGIPEWNVTTALCWQQRALPKTTRSLLQTELYEITQASLLNLPKLRFPFLVNDSQLLFSLHRHANDS